VVHQRREIVSPFIFLGGSLHADAIMDRIVHNSITIESGYVNMRERIHKK